MIESEYLDRIKVLEERVKSLMTDLRDAQDKIRALKEELDISKKVILFLESNNQE